jgi:hypothetical protein
MTTEVDIQAWRAKGRRIGRQILEKLDEIAVMELIRASGSDPEAHRNPLFSHAYSAGLRDALKEHRQADKRA